MEPTRAASVGVVSPQKLLRDLLDELPMSL